MHNSGNQTGRRGSRYSKLIGAFLAVAGVVANLAHAGPDSPPDKSGYNLFRPVPAELLRDLASDRPDKTESPFTVDAGHFQLEMDFLSYTRDHDTAGGANTRFESFAFAPFDIRIGLLNNVDCDFMFDTYLRERETDRVAGTVTKRSGYGDLTARVKINLWGNDGGTTAFALLPFVKFPTHQNGLGSPGIEGGLILPLAISLPGEWELGLMTEFDCVRTEGRHGYHAEFVNSITASHSIYGPLGGYVEFFSQVSGQRRSRWVGTFDLGLTYAVTKNVQLDAGVNIGVTRAADDLNPFFGLTVRF